jgi:hypothetical protein
MVSLGIRMGAKAGKIHSFKAVGDHRWYNSTFTSVPLHPRESIEQRVAMWLAAIG